MLIAGVIAVVLSSQASNCGSLINDLAAAPSEGRIAAIEQEIVNNRRAALPFLLNHLDDSRQTSVSLGPVSFGQTEYQPRLRTLDPATLQFHVERVGYKYARFEKYKLKVADICMDAIGRIVNRPYGWAERRGLLPSRLSSPIVDPELADLIRNDWDGITDRQLAESFIRDCSLLDPDVGSLRRLARFYPKVAAQFLCLYFSKPLTKRCKAYEDLPILFDRLGTVKGAFYLPKPSQVAPALSRIITSNCLSEDELPFLAQAQMDPFQKKLMGSTLKLASPNYEKIISKPCKYIAADRYLAGAIELCRDLDSKPLRRTIEKLYARINPTLDWPPDKDMFAVAFCRALGTGRIANFERDYLRVRIARYEAGPQDGLFGNSTVESIFRATLNGGELDPDWYLRPFQD